MIDKVIVTTEEIQSTAAYKKANDVQNIICDLPYYPDRVSGWLTIGKIKGRDAMLDLYHVDSFKSLMLNELYDLKVLE